MATPKGKISKARKHSRQANWKLTLPGIVAHEAAVQGNVWLDVPNFGW